MSTPSDDAQRELERRDEAAEKSQKRLRVAMVIDPAKLPPVQAGPRPGAAATGTGIK